MQTKQSTLACLDDPVAQTLLHSTIPARLAYVWPDGTPCVVPIWFYWNGSQVVLGTPPAAPKVGVLKSGTKVCLTIDDTVWPYKQLLIRGTAQVEKVPGVAPEYALAAERYLGEAQGKAWVAQLGQLTTHMVRIAIQPEWVNIIDFEQRFPSAIAKAMAAMHG